MNRKERRSTEKKLKLTEFYAKQPLNEKFKRIAENIKMGNEKHTKFENEVLADLASQRDKKASDIVESTAIFIAKSKGIPYIDALNEANKMQEK